MHKNEWTARRILRELCSTDSRRQILVSFWKKGDETSRHLALTQLAKAIHFRLGSLKKLPVEKKAELLASRVGAADFEEIFEAALLSFHLHERVELMSACLDSWGIKHENGAIDEGDYSVPDAEKVRETFSALVDKFQSADVVLYLATAGLVMGETGSEWRSVTWPIVDEQATAEP